MKLRDQQIFACGNVLLGPGGTSMSHFR